MKPKNIASAKGIRILAPKDLSPVTAVAIVITDKEMKQDSGTYQLVTTQFDKAAQLVVGQSLATVTIHASAENAYMAIECVIKNKEAFKADVYVDGSLVGLRTDKGELKTFRSLAFIKAMSADTDKQFQSEFDYLVKTGIQLCPKLFSVNVVKEELMELANQKKGFKLVLPNFKLKEASEAVDEIVNAAIEKRAAYVSSFHTIGLSNPNATHIEVDDYAELNKVVIDHYDAGKQLVVVLHGNYGDGKTRCVIDPLLEYFCTAGAYPISVSARRSLAARFEKDERHYWNAINDLHSAPGVVGVGNTIFHEQFDPLTNKSKVLFIDEIEEERSHRAIGNGFIDTCAAYNQRKEQQIKQAQIVIVADANATDSTVNWLHGVTGQQVIVAKRKVDPKYFSVNYYNTKNQMTGEIKAQLLAGRNIVVFCDKKKEDVYDLLAGWKKDVKGLKCKLIDGEFAATAAGIEMMGNLDEASKEYQLLVITPVINSGVSIQNGHFDSVFVISSFTVLPTSVAQSIRRFRDVTELNLCFWGKHGQRATDAGAVMLKEFSQEMRHDGFTLAALNKKMEEEFPRKVVERTAWDNRMREDYKNTLLIMLEQQGFEINRVRSNEKMWKSGVSTAAKGKRMGQKLRNEFLMNAPVVSSVDIDKINRMGSAVTREQSFLIKAHAIRTGLGVTDISKDDIKFEENNGCALVSNTMMARANAKTYKVANTAFKVALLQALFEILEINPENWSGKYSNYNGIVLKDFIFKGKVTVGENTLPARVVFSMVFGEYVDPAKGSMMVIKAILAQFGLKHKSLGSYKTEPNGKRNVEYRVETTDKSKKAEKYCALIVAKKDGNTVCLSLLDSMKTKAIIIKSDVQNVTTKDYANFVAKKAKTKSIRVMEAMPELTDDELSKLELDPNYQSLLS